MNIRGRFWRAPLASTDRTWPHLLLLQAPFESADWCYVRAP
jgi:hypothetical protein